MNTISKIADQFSNIYKSYPKDVVDAIKEDHNGLRNFLEVLKDTDANMTERRRAYDGFSALLKSHSDAEEKIVYKNSMKLSGRELHIKVSEGYVEHKIANDLMKKLDKIEDAMEWSAHANVLAEIVEHHLDEEEEELLPLVRKASNADLDQEMLEQFLNLRMKTQDKVYAKNAGVLNNLQ